MKAKTDRARATRTKISGVAADSPWSALMADPELSAAILMTPSQFNPFAPETYDADIVKRMRANAAWLRPMLRRDYLGQSRRRR